MDNGIDAVVKKLIKITSSDVVDWNAFDEVLLKVNDINVYDSEYEETILSSYIIYKSYGKDGRLLPEAIRHFISCGYDVFANDGKNGGLALSSLCWSSDDEYILEAAKLLMNTGAPVIYGTEDDAPDEEPQGLIGSIEWKVSGAWSVYKDYHLANILEAYYQMAKANIDGKDYNSIFCYSVCIGEKVTSVFADKKDADGILSNTQPTSSFIEPIVIWFGEKPLVVNPYIDFIINPVYTKDKKETFVDISAAFSQLIGATLEKLEYLDSSISRLVFDNGYQIVFANRFIEDRNCIGAYQLLSVEKDCQIESININCICGVSGIRFGDRVTQYTENAIALFGENESYLLYIEGGIDKEGKLKLFPCSKELLDDYKRKYPVNQPQKICCFYENDALTSIRFDYEREFLYFKINGYPGMEVQLSYHEYDPSAIISLCSKEGNHINFEIRSE